MTALRNIGIFAHVDAGKTTLCEQLLRYAGAIRHLGAVDSGTAHTDRMDIERRRGISVRATTAKLDWKNTTIHLIDTPGHADFAFEVERSLWALDGAVLLISAAEGVQPQAEVLFRALRARHIPTIIFLNKIDREGADVSACIRQAREMLSPAVALYEDDEQLHEVLAEHDEAAMEAFLLGDIYPTAQLKKSVRELTLQGEAFPAFTGSALRDQGIPELLDAIVDLLPPPQQNATGPLSGVVFAVEPSDTMGRAAQVRLFSGTLKNRDALTLRRKDEDGIERTADVKVTQVRSIALEGRGEDIGQLSAGELGVVYGLGDVRVGQVLGDPTLLPRKVAVGELNTPLLMVKVTPVDPQQAPKLRAALELMSAEDPLLSLAEYAGELHVRVMGAIQLEVLSELLSQRFGLDVTFGSRNVIYRETITRKAVGFYAYTMPKPCWAVIKFEIEPLPRGSGVVFESVVPAREIMPRYQHQVEQAIPLAIRQGMLGWQVDDVKITLVGGEHHLIHTHPLDFIVATPIAFMDGLRRGGSTLLEPIVEMRISAPEGYVGKLMSEIVAMRGEVIKAELVGALAGLVAKVPMSTSVDFSVRLPQITAGRGMMSIRLMGYQACPEEVQIMCPRRGVHPLDTARYILAARSALDGGIFDA